MLALQAACLALAGRLRNAASQRDSHGDTARSPSRATGAPVRSQQTRPTPGARNECPVNPEKNLDYSRLAGNKRFVHVLDE